MIGSRELAMLPSVQPKASVNAPIGARPFNDTRVPPNWENRLHLRADFGELHQALFRQIGPFLRFVLSTVLA